MQSFSALLVTLILAIAAVSASPVQTRDSGDSYITCDDTPAATGVVYNGNDFFGLGSTRTTDSTGNSDQVLTHLDDNMKAYTADTATKFDFIKCKSHYLGTDTLQGTFGYLRQTGNTKNENCLQTKTGSVDTADQVMVSGVCSRLDTPGSDQQQQSWELFADGGLKFLSTRFQKGAKVHPTYFTTSSVNHQALKLNAGSIPKGSDGAAVLGFKSS